MSEELFKQYLTESNISFDASILEKLKIYAELLIEYNQKFNLTAITDLDDIYLKHFYDSLMLTKEIDLTTISNMVDVGTGAGFPGIVLKIFYPNIELFLVESNAKKISFLKMVCERLNLKNVNFINERAEDFARKNQNKFDLVTARAVSNLRVLAELCLPMVKVGGYFIPMKGKLEENLEESTFTINFLKGNIEKINNYELPILMHDRCLIRIKKTGESSKEYPRNYDKIIKNPLQKGKI